MYHKIEIKDGLYNSVLSGDIDFEGLLVALSEFEKLEKNNPPFYNRITDLTGATSIDLDYNEVFGLARKRMSAYLPDIVKSAFIVANDEQHGFARMFFSLNDHPKINFKLFTDLDEAIDWVKPVKNDSFDKIVFE